MSRQIKIRTREKNRTIRVLDKSARIAKSIKQSVIKTKESAEKTQNPSWVQIAPQTGRFCGAKRTRSATSGHFNSMI